MPAISIHQICIIVNLHNCDPVIQFSAVIMNIDDKLANDIRSMSSNTTVTFNANKNLSMEQEIVPSHMQILTHYFESTNPLHICRAKIIAFDQKPGQKESEYIQAFHAQIIDADLHLASAEEIFAQLFISRLHNQHVHRELISRRQTPNFKQILEYAVDQEAAMQRFQNSTNTGIQQSAIGLLIERPNNYEQSWPRTRKRTRQRRRQSNASTTTAAKSKSRYRLQHTKKYSTIRRIIPRLLEMW